MKKITEEKKLRRINRHILRTSTESFINTESFTNTEKMDNNTMDIFQKIENSLDRKEINKWERITGKDTIFISFVSDPPGSNFYSERAKNLILALDRLDYDYCVIHYENDRNYYQNCCYKPSYIDKKIKEYNRNVIWIDGDTFLKRNMGDFTNSSEDFDIGLVTYNKDMTGFIASPIFFKNTPNSIELIEKWSDHCRNKVENGICELDHDALKHQVLPELRNKIRIKLNWDDTNSLHNGSILNNVNSEVPNKAEIMKEMSSINRTRPFTYGIKDFIII